MKETLSNNSAVPNQGKNVLLIWPERDKSVYNFDPIGLITGQKTLFFPLPLLYVASALGEEWNYTLVDLGVSPLTSEQIANADFFLISVNLIQRYSTDRLLQQLLTEKKPVIIGGPLISTLDHLFTHPGISKVYGEIEAVEASHPDCGTTIAELLCRDMREGTLRAEYHAKGHPDLTSLRPPRYDLVKNSSYFALSMQTSRGCPHHCDFCQQIILYGAHRRKNCSQVEQELDALLDVGHNITVMMIDDNLMGDIRNPDKKREFIEVLLTIQRWQELHSYPFDFLTQCSLDIAEHEDVLLLMTKIGLNIMFVGIESIDNEALASVHKKQNIEHNTLHRIRTLQKYGIGIFAGVIIGFDNESPSTISKQIEFIEQSNIPLVGPSLLHALPLTKMYRRLSREGRISNDPDVLTREFRTNIISLQHPTEYYHYYLHYLDAIYKPRTYFSRCIRWIDGWNDAYVIPGKKGSIPSNVKIKRILRSLLYQGILSSYRLDYIRYILSLFIRYRKNYNKRSLALYLGYMFQLAYTSTGNARRFIKKLPEEIIDEWNSFQKKTGLHG